MKKDFDIIVFISNRESTCIECGDNISDGDLITLTTDREALCLSCSDLDHLIYLSSGDAALTGRSRKYSTLSAIVLKYSRARKRNERQGLLVEKVALEKAEKECLEDSEVRARLRERAAAKREKLDQQYIKKFAQYIRDFFPGCPEGAEMIIAEHACLKYSGRVGRTEAAKSFDKKVIELAVRAHIINEETIYNNLLANGFDRYEARDMVNEQIDSVLLNWRKEV